MRNMSVNLQVLKNPTLSNKVYKEKSSLMTDIKPQEHVYVDDIIFGSTKKEISIEFEKLMHDNQDKYVAEILKKIDFASVKTASTPIETNKALIKNEEAEDGVNSPFDLEAFSDSDYVGASLDRKSITGGCQFLGKRLNSWQSTLLALKTHPMAALVTTLQPWPLLQAINLATKGFKPYKSQNTHTLSNTPQFFITNTNGVLNQTKEDQEKLQDQFEAKKKEGRSH
ncbi:hypothetical protein Tco_0610256 [Tanacetum coccineum]